MINFHRFKLGMHMLHIDFYNEFSNHFAKAEYNSGVCNTFIEMSNLRSSSAKISKWNNSILESQNHPINVRQFSLVRFNYFCRASHTFFNGLI